MDKLANKALTVQEKLVELLGVKEDPSVSIIVNKEEASPRNEKFRILVKNSIKEALNKLTAGGYDKRLVAAFEQRLHKLEEAIRYEHDFQSVLIFISPQREEVITLPLEVTNRVVVDDTFEIRPLLRAVNRSFQYDVIVLSNKQTAFYRGFHLHLQKDEHARLPQGVEYYMEQFINKKTDPSKARTEAMRLYVNDIDHFIRTYTDMHTPLIVMGEEKLVAYFKNKTRRPDKILAEIHGSYDDKKTTEIRARIKEKIADYMQQRDQKLLERIQPDIDRLSYVSGIQEVWQVAAMREARVLLVEQDYAVEGYSVKDGLFLVFSQPQDEDYDYHADAIDDLVEMVLLQGGEVYFVAPGLLNQYDKIIVTTRY